MIVLGISGLENAVPFKKQRWPGLEEREYRISQGHDSAAALVVDGKVVAAAAEERFNGKKHASEFPTGAINYCLQEAGISLDQVDELTHGFDYAPYKTIFSLDSVTKEQYRDVFSREKLLSCVAHELPKFPLDRVTQVNHHLAHAASAFLTSGWEDCLTVVVDGMGEAHSASVFHTHKNEFKLLQQISAQDSIGILYSLITLHIGFDFNADEYKIMGLAPYGNPASHRAFFEQAVQYQEDGSFSIPLLHLNHSREERENYLASRRYLGEKLIKERSPEEAITSAHEDVAASLQECLDNTMLHLCSRSGERVGQRKLALAGGVALNCTANGKLLRSGCFDDIYVQPAAGDDGVALGAALYRSLQCGDTPVRQRMPVPFLGPACSTNEVVSVLETFRDQIRVTRYDSFSETCAAAAKMLADGMVLAWCRGRMEFGPRALGNRSIFADPGHPEMRDRINAMVKKREGFRPFAPAVTDEQVDVWFDVPAGTKLPYMVMIVDVRNEHREALPAITHVNGSARTQTVSEEGNPAFHELLVSVGETTGRQMLLNTSFNVKGQPMVNGPREAIETFLGTGIDCLFLENNLVQRAVSV